MSQSQLRKKVFILGDSIIKHVKSYSLSKSLDNCKVYVKDFPDVLELGACKIM